MRITPLLLLPAVAVGITACSAKTEPSASTTTKAPVAGSSTSGAGGASSSTAAGGGASSTTAGGGASSTTAAGGGSASGSRLEVALSSGATLSVAPTECTLGTNGSGTIKADGGKFALTFTNGSGTLTWTYDGGKLDVEVFPTVTGKQLVLSGLTDDGAGYSVEATCA